MSKILIVAEKPSVARAIASVVENKMKNQKGFLEGVEHDITWALGHLTQLADPEDYYPELKSWAKETLPIIPHQFLLKPAESKKEHWNIVKSLLRGHYRLVINACDAGREGELIFRYMYHLAGCKMSIKRLWLKETTPTAIKRAMENLVDGSVYDRLAMAAMARGQADWMIGINGTRAFTLAHKQTGRQKGALSVGRVQTPTLGLIVDREREIRVFIPEVWWEVRATFETDMGEVYKGRWIDTEENDKISSKARAEEIAARVKHFRGKINKIHSEKEILPPPHLLSLGDLQKQVNQRFGYSAAMTLELAQSLYENRLITYPRTDSRNLTVDISATLPDRLLALANHGAYANPVQQIIKNPVPAKGTVDDAGVSDHHAIIPTEDMGSIGRLNPDEKNIYDLVARTFIACFYPSAVILQQKLITLVKEERFLSTGRVIERAGWMQVFKDDLENEREQENALPAELKEITTINAVSKECKSQPPRRYTDASLISALEHASRLVDEKDFKQALKQSKGIGTPATRASILEKLISSGYVTRQGKSFVPTPLGEQIIDVVPEDLRSLELTAAWEQQLTFIEEGKGSPSTFIKGIHALTQKVVATALIESR